MELSAAYPGSDGDKMLFKLFEEVVENGYTSMAMELLACNKANIRLTDDESITRYRWTIMHTACKHGSLPLIQAIYKKLKQEIKCQDKLDEFINMQINGPKQTALHMACMNHTIGLDGIQFLVNQCNASCSIKDKDGSDALHYALLRYSLYENIPMFINNSINNCKASS